jgi:hypothetical protein
VSEERRSATKQRRSLHETSGVDGIRGLKGFLAGGGEDGRNQEF